MTTLKTDNKGFPFSNLRDRFRSPEQRFFNAIRRGDLDMIKTFIETHDFDVEMDTSHVFPKGEEKKLGLLHYVVAACPKSSQPAILHYLLEKGANPNRSSFFQATPVHFACANDNIDSLAILVNYGGELHKKAMAGTPFSMLSEGLRKEYENKGDDYFISIFQKKEVTENTADAPVIHRQPTRL